MSPRFARVWLASCLLAAPLCAPAQETASEATLHVYVNRMQIPVLLLDEYRHPTKPVPASRFTVEMEGTQPITPTAVRRQGNDPLSIAIVLDHSDPAEFLWEKLLSASANLAKSLRPEDRVEVYSLDGCKLRRHGAVMAPDAAQLRASLQAALTIPPYAKVRKEKGPCDRPITLWDGLLYAGGVLQQRGGRRILLELGNGQPAAPDVEMEKLRRLLNAGSTALFAVRHGEAGVGDTVLQLDGGRQLREGRESNGHAPIHAAGNMTWAGYPLAIEAELSGGMVMSASLQSLPRTLSEVIDRVRGRYIVEFPRPPQLTAGAHALVVSIGKTRDFIRPAGISVPVATAAELAKEPEVEQAASAPVRGDAYAPDAAETEKQAGAVPAPSAPVAVVPTKAQKPVEIDPLDITDEVQRVPAR